MNRNKRLHGIHALVLSVGTSFYAAGAAAQTAGASINGQVTDAALAAIPKATVTVQNVDQGLVQHTTTDAQGNYRIGPLPPGHYVVTVEEQGFRKYVQSGIVLSVDQPSTQNVVLPVGDVQQTVNVDANGEVINTTSAELGQVVNQNAISQLPLNGRDPSSLVLLAPGTTNVLNTGGGVLQSGFAFPNETAASANGGRQGSTYYLLDGVPNIDTYLLLTAPFPNADATQEFRVITNNFDAHYGFAPGAVVSIETKSGTNAIHGGIFEFLRNNDFNAGNYFTHQVDSLKRNQFGGFIGGPIRKDKLFAFFNYQGTRSTSASATNTAYTPTAAMLAGDFSAVPIALKGPFATVNGKSNQVDPALFSPAAVTITNTGLPLGQIASSGQVNYTTGKIVNNFDEGTGRLDYDISQSQRLTLRSFVDYFNQPSGDINGNILSVLILPAYTQIMNEPMEYYNEVVSHTWTLSPNLVNSIAAFWNQMSSHSSAAVNDKNGQPMCLSRYIQVSDPTNGCFIEGLNIANGFQTGYTEPSQEVRTSFGVSETLTETKGNHTLAFGVNAWHQYAKESTQYPGQPIVSFDGQFTGFGLADFLLGYVNNFQQGGGELAAVKGWQIGVFAQDQFKLRPNLTITAGVRWDPNLPPAMAGNRGNAFIPGEHSTRFPNAPTGLVFPGDPGVNASLMPTSYSYVEPRVGFAWQPRSLPKTSIRGGFGLFDAPLAYSVYNQTADISPFSPTFNFSASTTPISFQNPWASFPGTGGVSPFPPFTSASFQPPADSTFATPISIPETFAQNFRLATTESWNLSVDQQYGQSFASHIAYVGSESYHLNTLFDRNPGIFADGGNRTIYPDFSNIYTYGSFGTSPYHSLQAGIEKQLSHNLQFQSNFTWSKTIDLSSAATFGNPRLGDPFDIRWNRGISYLNVPIISVSNFVYRTPGLTHRNALLQNTLGGWEISGIITAQSGSPFSISGGNGGNNSGALQYGDRADYGTAPLRVHQGSKQQWLSQYFNADAFTTNAPGTFGNTPKNFLRGPAVNTADLGLMKNWLFAERYNLQFRWEMFNALNHPSFATPNNDPSSTSFGQITSIGAIPPRVGQAALKLTF